MSVAATTWAWRQPSSSSGQRLVLLALADHASDHDDPELPGFTCWPKVATLCAMTNLTDSTVRGHIASLVRIGLVEIVERKIYGRRAGPNIYRLAVRRPTGDAAKTADEQAVIDRLPTGGHRPPTDRRSLTADRQALKREPLVEPIVEPLETPLPLSGSVSVEVVADEPPTVAFDEFWSAWPKRVAKVDAEKAWSKMTESERAAAIEAVPQHCELWKRERRASSKVPYPATWLNRKSWTDEVVFVEAASTSPGADALRRRRASQKRSIGQMLSETVD